MTTATKSAADEVAELAAQREDARAKVTEAKRRLEQFEAELPDLRAHYSTLDPDSAEARKVKAEIEARVASTYRNEGEHRAAYDEAFGPYAELDSRLEEMRRERCRDLVDEQAAQADPAIERMHDALAELADAAGEYLSIARAVNDLAAGTPGLQRQPNMSAWDPRVELWHRLALDAVDSNIARPGLSQSAEARL